MSSRNRSPSLESIASSALSTSDEGFKLDHMPVDPTCTISVVERATTSKRHFDEGGVLGVLHHQDEEIKAAAASGATEGPAYSEHTRFFLPTENIFFVVTNTIYSVPRAPFEKHSSAFAGRGLTRDNPLVLEDVTAAHLDNFLAILYPSEYGVYTATSVEEWTSILHLAIRWGFHSIKKLSIKRLSPIASDIDKIILGRQYAIDEWLGDAYLAVCMREESLTEEEGMRIKVEDIIKINNIRQKFGLGLRPNLVLPISVGDVRTRFGLSAPPDFERALGSAGTRGTVIDESSTPAAPEAVISPAHLSEGPIEPTSDAAKNLVHLNNGDGTGIQPPEPAMLATKAQLDKLKADWVKERKIIVSVLLAYTNPNTYSQKGKGKEAINRRLLLNFVASYKAEQSGSL